MTRILALAIAGVAAATTTFIARERLTSNGCIYKSSNETPHRYGVTETGGTPVAAEPPSSMLLAEIMIHYRTKAMCQAQVRNLRAPHN